MNTLHGDGQESGGWANCQVMAHYAPARSCSPVGQIKRAMMGVGSPGQNEEGGLIVILKVFERAKGGTSCSFFPLLCSFGSYFTEHILCTRHLMGTGDMGTNKADHWP